MARDFDLFGNPLPRNHGQPGRNEHVPTAENANKIRLLLVADWTCAQIAAELGISVPTLRKHYFQGRRNPRELALAEVRGRVLLQLDQEAAAGNVSAMKEIRKVAEIAALDRLPKTPSAQAEKLGKKEQRRRAAHRATGGWGERLPGTDVVQ